VSQKRREMRHLFGIAHGKLDTLGISGILRFILYSYVREKKVSQLGTMIQKSSVETHETYTWALPLCKDCRDHY